MSGNDKETHLVEQWVCLSNGCQMGSKDTETDSAGSALLLLALDTVQIDVVQLGVASPIPNNTVDMISM